jgi:hypothetical protein
MTLENKNLKFLLYFVLAWIGALMLGAMLKGSVSNSEPIAMNAVGFPSARLGASRATALRSYGGLQSQFSRTQSHAAPQHMISGIASSPMAKLAISAIEANNRQRDFSLKASADADADVKSELSSMDSETKEKVEEVKKAVALKAKDMAGVTGPMGFFDPAGFATDIPEGKLLFYREVELKHGRVGMLAALGLLVGENFHPLFGGDIDVPSYIAFQQTPLQTFWGAVVAAIAIPEIFSVQTFNSPFGMDPLNSWWTVRSERVPGDLGFDPLGLKPTDPEEFKEMQTKELNNGRLAMIAAAGMIAQELATGNKLFA